MSPGRAGSLAAGTLLVLAGWVVLEQSRPSPASPQAQTRPDAAASPAWAPDVRRDRDTRLEFDRLGVYAPLVPVQARAGVLTPPDDPATAGWWRGGARPGSRHGAVLLTGHSVLGGDGAFDDLGKAVVGDRLSLRHAGRGTRYVVDQVWVLTRRQLARRAQRLFSGDGPARLVLVTCESWNGSAYDANVVVLARRSAPGPE